MSPKALPKKLVSKVTLYNNEVPHIDENSVKKRYQLRQHIQKGEIDEAINLIKEMKENFDIEDEGIRLIFSLKCLKVVELIKKNEIEKCIIVAK